MPTRRERELLKDLDQAYERIDELESYIASGQELIQEEEGAEQQDGAQDDN